MRPARDVLSRLQWDSSLLDASDVSIGYVDRFEGIKEIDFYAWLAVTGDVTDEEFIPQHRIRYFVVRASRVVLWDKSRRIDRVFGSACGGEGGRREMEEGGLS